MRSTSTRISAQWLDGVRLLMQRRPPGVADVSGVLTAPIASPRPWIAEVRPSLMSRRLPPTRPSSVHTPAPRSSPSQRQTLPTASSRHRIGRLTPRLLPVQVALGALMLAGNLSAQSPDSLPSPGTLKNMSLEQLMAIEVSSVSRRPERLSETASAIQVITRDDIRRSGATRLPEALRLATNLEVDQLDASQWAISARGFNSGLANKLLVLIDGRTIYSPLFAGVFWDQQDVLLEDIEQIEVISGPGATVWGANAVNGVINITTRPAKETQGLLAVAGGGNELHGLGAVRYGAELGSKAHVRAYGKYWDRDGTALPSGQDLPNDWTLGQGGFRLDWDASSVDAITLQGDLYEDRTDLTPDDLVARGRNVMARWSRRLSEHSDLKVQAYVDRVHRKVPGAYDDVLNTYDVDAQHRILLGGDTTWSGAWGTGGWRITSVRSGWRSPPSGSRSRRSADSRRTRLP
jgi:iron complex outermembrane recepter protein